MKDLVYKTFEASANNGVPEADAGSKNDSRGKTCFARCFARKLAGVVAMAAVITFSAISCGGGGGSAGGVKLKSNKYLGNFPGLIANNELAKKAYEENIEKLREAKNIDKITKLNTEEKERKEKFEAAIESEEEKIKGNDIPFTYSDEFKKLKIDVAYVKIKEGGKVSIYSNVSVVAKEDFKINAANYDDYSSLYFRIVSSDGSAIEKNKTRITGGSSFTKGEELNLLGQKTQIFFSVYHESEKWVDFAGIEFITKAEYDAIKD